jgi:sugar phosphate isomerase/epimerase
MRIRYVVSTMVFWGRENKLSFEQECELLKSLGFGVELWPNIRGYSDCRYERYNWSRLAEATKGMLVSMRSRNDSPTLQQWSEQIECAKMLDADIVADFRSLHICDDPDTKDFDFAAEIVKLAEKNKIKLCIETGNLQKVKKLGEEFDSIWYCLDTGYANLDPNFSFIRYVDDLVQRVAYLHLTDNYGHFDDHEPPGVRGGISRENWDYLLDALNKYDNDVIGSLEMSPCMPDVMIRHASKFLFDVVKWPNRPKKLAGYSSVIYNPF